MTIHKAKGLEFPVVFVPDLNAARRGPRGTVLNRADWGLTLKLSPATTARRAMAMTSRIPTTCPSVSLSRRAWRKKTRPRGHSKILRRPHSPRRPPGPRRRGLADKRRSVQDAGCFLQDLASVLNLDSPQVLTLRERSSDGQDYVCQVRVRYEATPPQPSTAPGKHGAPRGTTVAQIGHQWRKNWRVALPR